MILKLRIMSSIKVWFYDPCNDPNGLINHCVSKLDPPYCHCEIQIDQFSYCIYMGSNVMRKARTFTSPPYTAVNIPCSVNQKLNAKKFADSQVANEVKFSTVAFVMAPVPVVSYSGCGTFCSKLCADILKAGGLAQVQDQNTNKLTPSALYRILTACGTQASTGKIMAIDFRT